MKAYALSNVGKVRGSNEDAFYLPGEGERFAAVADGMGGHLAGEVASAMAISTFAEKLRPLSKPDEETLKGAVEEANARIFRAAGSDPLKRGMGTTLTALWFGQDTMYLAHVGDSRAYLMRNRALMQLSNDHSLVNELVERGQITPTQALTHPQRNYITRALGTSKQLSVDILRLDYLPGDIWLLCSDGLSNYLHSPEMAEILLRAISWEEKLEEMVGLALKRGGADNITCLIVPGEEVLS